LRDLLYLFWCDLLCLFYREPCRFSSLKVLWLFFRVQRHLFPQVPRRLFSLKVLRLSFQLTIQACFLQIRRIFSVTVRRFSSQGLQQFLPLISSCPLPRLLVPEHPRLSSRPIPSRELFPS
jgi:hypothetical protein